MGLPTQWYDLLCYAIVVASILGSFLFIRRNSRHRRVEENLNKYVSLLLEGRPMPREPLLSRVDSTSLWTTCWRGIHPLVLLLFRFVSAVLLLALLCWDIADWDVLIFVYYTEWTLTIEIVYFSIGTLISAHGCWNYSKQLHKEIDEGNIFVRVDLHENKYEDSHSENGNRLKNYMSKGENQRAGTLGYTMQIMYQICAGAVMMTDIVFWGLIAPFLTNAHFKVNPLMGCIHSLNFILLLVDTFLNNMQFPFFRVGYFVIWSCTYVIFQWILHACGFSWWPYPFLELDTPWAPLWYFTMAAVHIPFFGLYFLTVKAKDTFFPIFFPNAYVKSH